MDLTLSPEIEEAYNKAVNSIMTLSEEKLAELNDASIKLYGNPYAISSPSSDGSEKKAGHGFHGKYCYGDFEKCTVIFSSGMMCVVTTQEIAGHTFSYGKSFSLICYRDGVFYPLKEAYEKNFITAEEIGIAAERHKTVMEYNSLNSAYYMAIYQLKYYDQTQLDGIEKAFSDNNIPFTLFDIKKVSITNPTQ